MTVIEAVLAWWPVVAFWIAMIGAIVVWVIRLEGLVKLNRRETENLEKRVDHLHDDIKTSYSKIDSRLSSMTQTLERIIFRLPKPHVDHIHFEDEDDKERKR